MPRLSLAVAALLLSTASVARAQATQLSGIRDTSTTARRAKDVSVDSAVADLGRAVAVLAANVQDAVTQTANKPEVRLAAVQLAGRAVSIAQQAVVQNTSELERLLAEASRLLAAAESAQKAKTATP